MSTLVCHLLVLYLLSQLSVASILRGPPVQVCSDLSLALSKNALPSPTQQCAIY